MDTHMMCQQKGTWSKSFYWPEDLPSDSCGGCWLKKSCMAFLEGVMRSSLAARVSSNFRVPPIALNNAKRC